MKSDRQVLLADALTREIRHWLRPRVAVYGANVVSGALGYELAALIAAHAADIEAADGLIDEWATVMKDQVRRLGIRVEHP